MDGRFEAMWIAELLAIMALWWLPTIVALVLIGRGIAARGRMSGLDVLDIVMVLVFSGAGALVYFLIAFLRHRQESGAEVAVSPVIVESETTLQRVDEAYARAWAEARTAADDDLIDALHQAKLGPSWTEPGRPRADLLFAIWRAGRHAAVRLEAASRSARHPVGAC
ncbi:hypothetical protein NBCG_02426 [Nocardioidaceae bacterium Broad-1]|nr:hypothetical protein NBCG_02426 [Nocardioidaceae bacterium Broad-1]